MNASDKNLASASPASGNLALLAAIVVFAAITPTILMTAPPSPRNWRPSGN
ncbi:permease [Pseudomonas aeruginosa]|nr:permease [Pseudomonas aeruginosa]